jgi:hypothetical protein
MSPGAHVCSSRLPAPLCVSVCDSFRETLTNPVLTHPLLLFSFSLYSLFFSPQSCDPVWEKQTWTGIQWNPVWEFAGRATGFGCSSSRVILHGALQQGDASRRPPRAGAGLVGSTSPADAAPWESLSLPPYPLTASLLSGLPAHVGFTVTGSCRLGLT